jgi:hypothetical protein
MISRKQMDQMGMPVGNPHKPPFNRREMPFFIAPAIAGVAAASGFVATTLAVINVVGVIASVAGTAMSVVGMVTGDKSLMKLGAIVGLAGGVTSLASGAVASLASGGEFAFGTAGIESANAANAASAASAAQNAGLGLAANSTNALQNAVTPQLANVGDATQITTGLGGQVGQMGQGITPTFESGLVGQASGHGLLGTAAQSGAFATAAPVSSGLMTADQVATLTPTLNSTIAGTGSSGFFDKLVADMTPKDYLLMGGSVVSGGMQAVKENQANAAEQQQYEYKQAQRNTRLKNINTPLTLSPKNTLQVGNYSKNPDLAVNI